MGIFCGKKGDIMLDLTLWRDWRSRVPAECPGCGQRLPGQGLCVACEAALAFPEGSLRCRVCMHPLVAGSCPDCARQTPVFDRIVAAFDYAGLGQTLIHDYKVRCSLPLASLLADRLVQAVRAAGPARAAVPDWVVPVPARQAALRQRGFSPPAEIGRLVARRLGLRYRLDLVQRVREGPKQAMLERGARLRAQAGAYACVAPAGRRGALPGSGQQALGGARVAVVDDVLTTGATLQAVAVALKTAGASAVEGWVLARAVDMSP